jgi:hypothetical protein
MELEVKLNTIGMSRHKGSIKYYSREVSHVGDCQSNEFLFHVYNHGTWQFKNMSSHFNKIDFTKIKDTLSGKRISSRGNIQECFGVSVLDIT